MYCMSIFTICLASFVHGESFCIFAFTNFFTEEAGRLGGRVAEKRSHLHPRVPTVNNFFETRMKMICFAHNVIIEMDVLQYYQCRALLTHTYCIVRIYFSF
jgi:hypothetical protein